MYSLKQAYTEIEKYIVTSKLKNRNELLFFRDVTFSQNQIAFCEALLKSIWQIVHPQAHPRIDSDWLMRKKIYTLFLNAFEYSMQLQESRIYDDNQAISDGGMVGHSTLALTREQFRKQCKNGYGTGIHSFLHQVVEAFDKLDFVIDLGIEDKSFSLTENEDLSYIPNSQL